LHRSTIFQFLNRQLILTGTKVRLRPRRLEDAADQYRWRCDEELCGLDASIPTSFAFSEFLDRYSVELEYPGLTCTMAIDTWMVNTSANAACLTLIFSAIRLNSAYL
jgi:hypothetical protein